MEPKPGNKDKNNGVCLCFALKHPFMKCGFCWRQQQHNKSTPWMHINENAIINKSPDRGKSGGKGVLKYIGGGGWKRLSPDPETERGHKWAASAFKPIIKWKQKSPKKDQNGKTITWSPSP